MVLFWQIVLGALASAMASKAAGGKGEKDPKLANQLGSIGAAYLSQPGTRTRRDEVGFRTAEPSGGGAIVLPPDRNVKAEKIAGAAEIIGGIRNILGMRSATRDLEKLRGG